MASLVFFICNANLPFKVTYSSNRNIIHGKDDQKYNYRQEQLESYIVKYDARKRLFLVPLNL